MAAVRVSVWLLVAEAADAARWTRVVVESMYGSYSHPQGHQACKITPVFQVRWSFGADLHLE
jgi:hypothetical protein